jgi:hypothetical protein
LPGLIGSRVLFIRSGRGRMVFQTQRHDEAQMEPML